MLPKVAKIDSPDTKYQATYAGSVPVLSQAREHRFLLKSGERVFLHPKSLLFTEREYEYPYILYTEKIQTSKMFVTDCTTTQPYPLLLFGDVEVLHDQQVIVIDKWIKFSAPARIAVIMKEIRTQLNTLLQEKISQPTLDISNHVLTDVVTELITTDGL